MRETYKTIAGRQDRPLQIVSVDPAPDRAQTANLTKIASDLGATLGRRSTDPGQGLTTFEAADLIGREMRRLDLTPVKEMFQGKRVLVTGAGGSIGSELSQQIAVLNPASLILVDHSELHLYNLEKRLAPLAPKMKKAPWRTFLGDIRNAPRMREIFKVERPQIVLHLSLIHI